MKTQEGRSERERDTCRNAISVFTNLKTLFLLERHSQLEPEVPT